MRREQTSLRLDPVQDFVFVHKVGLERRLQLDDLQLQLLLLEMPLLLLRDVEGAADKTRNGGEDGETQLSSDPTEARNYRNLKSERIWTTLKVSNPSITFYNV